MWTELSRSGQNRTNVDRIESMWTEWIELDRSRLNKTEWAELDRIELQRTEWTEWTEQDQIRQNGPNRTNLDIIGTRWTYWTEVDRIRVMWTEQDGSGQNGPNRTNMDRIKLLNIYHFYCIFGFIFLISNVYFSYFF